MQIIFYGYAMLKPMLKHGFKWVRRDLNSFDVLSISDDSSKGYTLKVGVACPIYLHETHRELPLLTRNTYLPKTKENKLLTTLYDKLDYVCNYIKR